MQKTNNALVHTGDMKLLQGSEIIGNLKQVIS